MTLFIFKSSALTCWLWQQMPQVKDAEQTSLREDTRTERRRHTAPDAWLQDNARVSWQTLWTLDRNEWMLFEAVWESRDLSTLAELGLGILCTVFMSSKWMVLKRRWRIKVKLRKTLSHGYTLTKMISSNLQEDRWKIWKRSERTAVRHKYWSHSWNGYVNVPHSQEEQPLWSTGHWTCVSS